MGLLWSPACPAAAPFASERGAALVIVLMAAVLLTALAGALVLVTAIETAIAANDRSAREAFYAADAAVERAVQDLMATALWDHVLAGAVTSTFVDVTRAPRLADGRVLDLVEATRELQAGSDSANLWGSNNPVWRLFAYGPLDALVPGAGLRSAMYVAVWVADDGADVDDNPLADSNGVLALRAVAFGPGGIRKTLEATVERTADPVAGVRMLSWRELR